MSVDIRSSDRRRYMNELQAREKEIAAGLLKTAPASPPQVVPENEKRVRREIANSNERRRMQCINAGFSNLRALIPHTDGEKLSKAAILQQASDYICSLEKEKGRLQLQLDHTQGLLSGLGQDRPVTDAYVSSSPPPSKRKKRDTVESSDEGVCSLSDASEDNGSELQQENLALGRQLELERQRYTVLEQHNRLLEAQFLTLVHSQASHISAMSEMQPSSLDQRSLHAPESLYNRQVINQEVPGHTFTARYEYLNSPRVVSPSLDQRASTHTSEPLGASSSQMTLTGSSDQRQDSVTTGEAISATETRLLADTISPALTSATTTDQHSYHHHNYCHRDHPRRRHRQQTQLQQQREEEELRRRQEGRTVHEQMMYQRSHNTQNLEKLVEAIRQIEGDRLLSHFNEDEHKHLNTEQSMPSVEESEREVSSDQDEPRSESSGRDSPMHHHHHRHLQQQMSSFSSKNVSETYPVSSTLLHCPITSSSHRPGVIVHKL
ncbi:unnamed protein product [Candidula unifasciata]|uniref:BHLH domain-containing protein n=1 Tax=Candidula unifasciata TaxID=100452 RepID=A0A8S3Z3K0_9EUPU|nr:unnamed protein product [Candidula unifasciata]